MILIGFLSLKWQPNKRVKHHHHHHPCKQTNGKKRPEQNVVPRFRLSVSEHSCRYYNILSDRILFLTKIVNLVTKVYRLGFDHEMVE